ncbi:MAG: hypothetical protein ACQEUJ_15460 [Pseudomonadota bacterium]
MGRFQVGGRRKPRGELMQIKAGSWKLEAGSWKLEAGSWKLEAGRQHEPPTAWIKLILQAFS